MEDKMVAQNSVRTVNHTISAIFKSNSFRGIRPIIPFFIEIKSERIEQLIVNEKNINKLKILLAIESYKLLYVEIAY